VTIENEIARDILAYLIDNPAAQDTLEGITEWWLLEQKIKNQRKIVQEALDELVERGLIITREIEHSGIVYKINEEKVKTIEELLRERESE
jgi:hypothetical protein